MHRLSIALSIVFLCTASFAQMAPTPGQHKKLMERREKIIKLQDEITRLQTELSFELSQLQLASQKIILENRWPANTQFNPQTFGFAEPPLSVQQNAQPPASSPAQMKMPASTQPENQK